MAGFGPNPMRRLPRTKGDNHLLRRARRPTDEPDFLGFNSHQRKLYVVEVKDGDTFDAKRLVLCYT